MNINNMISLQGNVGKDPQGEENRPATFMLAVNRRGGKKVTDWFKIEAWHDLADFVMKEVKSGNAVRVIGEFHIY